MTQFHSDEYVEFLNKITPNNMNQFVKEQLKCKVIFIVAKAPANRIVARRLDNVGDDCPVFDGLFEFCSISAGGSMGTLFYFQEAANSILTSPLYFHRGRSAVEQEQV